MFNSKKKFVGILGGTFDPPHEGHLFISKFAKIKLDVGEVWWIVTTTNPLKKNKLDYKKRLKKVKRFLINHHIKVLEIQDLSKNTYTVDLLEYLFKKFPHKKFIWLMGADNLFSFHLWRDWKKIFYNIPIAIFDRPPYSLSISKAKAILYFKEDRINSKLSRNLKFMKPPKWLFLTGLTNLQSSTKIRQKKVESA
ncbi:nicotinate-nicotinamide nucleotide adenylyltransferase [Alphaproteobacteria bacterium]|nr:nicotinate-nicotinamide nucleotide adenylyltransferase [Alphaproteobacteria bacterium]